MDASMISVDVLNWHGTGLNRPECVLAHQSGLLFAPCWDGNGGVSIIALTGKTTHILAEKPPEPLKPNGIALEAGGTFLLAHLGAERGGVYRLYPDGQTETVTETADGTTMPPANFVTIDHSQRIWVTVSTQITPRSDDYRNTASTGFIAVVEGGDARIVADGLGYTNEIAFSDDGKTLWVNETFARRTSAFDIGENCVLTNKRTIAEYGHGTFPDGLTPDTAGGLWVTSIVSNRVLHVDASGSISTVIEDCDPAHLAWVEEAFKANAMDRPHLDKAMSKRLKNISNLAFGGPDRSTAYLGCLLGDSIASFDSPVTGVALPHWDVDLGPLSALADPV